MRVKLKSIIGYVGTLIPLLIILSYTFFLAAGTPFPVSMITGSSMEPTLHEGDVVIWTPVRMEDVGIGDIVVFRSYVYPGRIISHRVVEITEFGGERYFKTKGDGNNYTDQGPAPHAPEPYVTKDNFLGKLVCVGGNAVKISSASNPFFLSQQLVSLEPGVFIGTVLLIIITICIFGFTYFKTRKPREISIDELILGPGRVRALKVFGNLLILFLIFSLISARFFYSSEDINVAVSEPTSETTFGNLNPGESKSENFTFENNAIFPTKGVVFSYGRISDYIVTKKPVFSMGPKETTAKEITVNIPDGTKPGVYDGKVYSFFSPLWLILPTPVMETFSGSMNGIIVLYILSSIIWSVVLTMVLLLINKTMEKYEIHHTYKSLFASLNPRSPERKITFKRITGWISGIDWIDIKPVKPVVAALISIMFIPVMFLGGPVLVILISAFFSGIVTYVLGCRWRAGIILSGIVSECLILGFIVLPFFSSFPYNNPYLFAAATTFVLSVFLIVFLLLFLPVCLLSYSGGCMANFVYEKINPAIRAKGDTDI